VHTYCTALRICTLERLVFVLSGVVFFCGLGSLAAEPDALAHILVVHFVENTITGKHYKIVLLVDVEGPDIGLSHHNFDISTTVLELCFGVAKGTTHGQATWKYSDRTNNVLRIGLGSCLIVFALRERLGCGGLVNLTSGGNNSLVLIGVGRLMISAESDNA